MLLSRVLSYLPMMTAMPIPGMIWH